MVMSRPSTLTVLVTGASTGLGLAIARKLIAAGHQVVLTARAESLPRFAEEGITEGPGVWLRALDVTRSDQREPLVDWIEAELGGVDVLVNNAGVSYRAVVEHVTETERMGQLDVNFRSAMEMARLVLPGMRARRWGRIISVSSVGGMMAMPTMGVYSASKWALEGASEALWYEVRPWNIGVTLIEPGFINSDGFLKVRYTPMAAQASADPTSPYYGHYTHMAGFIGKVMRRVRATPESVADKVLKTIDARNPPLRVAATLDAWIFFWLRRLLPRRLYHWVLYRNLPGVRTWGDAPPQVETQPARSATQASTRSSPP